MTSRKRKSDEMEAQASCEPELNMLQQLRNSWEFANLMQYIFIFGKAVKIDDDLGIEDLERECLVPGSSRVLASIGLALLKYVSSHRGLTPEIFDEYTRRQYWAKAPLRNPFGEEDEALRFNDFDVFTKLKVLVQLSQWTLINTDRIREKMEERTEGEQAIAWRVDVIGYDKADRHYFVLDDNRLYRRTDPPLPPAPKPKPKSNSKKGRALARAVRRRSARTAAQAPLDEVDEEDEADNDVPEGDMSAEAQHSDDDHCRKWECVAVTLAEYNEFLDSISKSRDEDERELRIRITEDVLPIIEAAEATQVRKRQKQEREMINLVKMSGAKRSSRIEAKIERERHEREAEEVEEKRRNALVEARAMAVRQAKMEEDRASRMMTREQRLKEREMKRILHEAELVKMAEEEKKVDAGESRLSERRLKADIERKKRELAELEETTWTFDCAKCGVHGDNLDDGTHSIACDKCSVWQHIACLGFSQSEVENEDFHFVCADCKRREEDAKKPKIPSLKFRVPGTTSSPLQVPVEVIHQNGDVKGEVLESLDKTHDLQLHPIPSEAMISPSVSSQPLPQTRTQQSVLALETNFKPPSEAVIPHIIPQAQTSSSLQAPTTRTPTTQQAAPQARTQALNGMQPQQGAYHTWRHTTNASASKHQANNNIQLHQTSGPSPSQISNTTTQSRSNDIPNTKTNGQAASPGWSARYIHPTSEIQTQSPSYAQSPLQADINPFADSLALNNTHHHQPPQQTFSFSPPQPQTTPPHIITNPSPSSPQPISTPVIAMSTHINGIPLTTAQDQQQQPVGLPSQSPTKKDSPQSAHRATRTISPIAALHQPDFHPRGINGEGEVVVAVGGVSPVKHDSPRVDGVKVGINGDDKGHGL